MYDLLIKGGRAIDPALNLDDELDVATSGDKIAKVAKDIAPQQSRRVVDASEKIVAPGLIDLHCHVYDVIPLGVKPDTVGVRQGVTTVVDAGSAGQAIFGGFPRYVIPSSRTTVLCFLNLGSQGLFFLNPDFQGLSKLSGLRDWDEINPDATIATIESNRDAIVGVKVRMVGRLVADAGVEVVKIAKRIARKFSLPTMVHIGDAQKQVSPTLTRELLPLMEPGDILTHVFTPRYGGILRSDGAVLPELREAMERGVVLDVAHSVTNFSFEVARKSMAQGILPTTLSTDIAATSLGSPIYSLLVTMSKFVALGLDLKQVLEMTTINPARAIGIADNKGSLKPGADADISILKLVKGTWRLEDGEKQAIRATSLVASHMTVKSGQIIREQLVAQPLLPMEDPSLRI